jgi:hypothetical protein
MPHRSLVKRISVILTSSLLLVTAFAARQVVPAASQATSHAQQGHKAVSVRDMPTVHLESKPYIDGAQTPNLIPDEVGYSLFLRMLMTGETNDAGVRQRMYIKHVLRGAAAVEYGEAGVSAPPKEEDVSNMLRFIASYEVPLRTVDAGGIASRSEAIPLVRATVARMPTYLGHELAHQIDRYVKEQFKRRVKLVP